MSGSQSAKSYTENYLSCFSSLSDSHLYSNVKYIPSLYYKPQRFIPATFNFGDPPGNRKPENIPENITLFRDSVLRSETMGRCRTSVRLKNVIGVN